MGQALYVSEGSRVLLEYTLSSESVVIESSAQSGPLDFVIGSGKLHPLIEKQLCGRRLYEDFEVVIDPSLAFGEVDPKLIIEIPRHRLPENLQESRIGQYFEAKDFEGKMRRFRCVKLEGPVLTFDGNHELAGQSLFLEGRILRLLDP